MSHKKRKQKSKKAIQQKQSAILLSYLPLLWPHGQFQAGQLIHDTPERLTNHISDAVNRSLKYGTAVACLWTNFDEGITPIFILEKGKEIARHLRWWAEGAPEKWFKLYFHDGGETKYAIALYPDLDRSVSRQKTSYAIMNGITMPTDTKYTLLFKPLFHWTKSDSGPTTFTKLKDKLPLPGQRCQLGIVDAADFDMEHPLDLAPDKIDIVGKFEIGKPEDVKSYFDSQWD